MRIFIILAGFITTLAVYDVGGKDVPPLNAVFAIVILIAALGIDLAEVMRSDRKNK